MERTKVGTVEQLRFNRRPCRGRIYQNQNNKKKKLFKKYLIVNWSVKTTFLNLKRQTTGCSARPEMAHRPEVWDVYNHFICTVVFYSFYRNKLMWGIYYKKKKCLKMFFLLTLKGFFSPSAAVLYNLVHDDVIIQMVLCFSRISTCCRLKCCIAVNLVAENKDACPECANKRLCSSLGLLGR